MNNPKTVRVESKGGFTTINESDFDEKVHKIFKEKPVVKEPTVKELKAELDKLEVEYDAKDNKAKLEELLKAKLETMTDPE